MGKDKTKTIAEIHSAGKSQMGFFYQFLCFVEMSLNLMDGEVLSYEIKDDIAIDTPSRTILMQIKHTTQTYKRTNVEIKLRENVFDIWHTIGTWCDFLLEKEGNGEDINNYEFRLITNKSGDVDMLKEKLSLFSLGSILMKDLLLYFDDIKLDEANSKSRSKISNLSDNAKEVLFKNLMIITDESKIVDKTKDFIFWKYSYRKDEMTKVNAIYDTLLSNLFQEIYSNKGEYEITNEKIVATLHDIIHGTSLPVRTPGKFASFDPSRLSIVQLLDIEACDVSDEEFIVDVLTKEETAQMTIDDWRAMSGVSSFSIEKEIISRTNVWKRKFRTKCFELKGRESESGQISEKDINTSAQQLYNEIMDLAENDGFGSDFGQGVYYLNSDTDLKKIGWRYDWENKYKNY